MCQQDGSRFWDLFEVGEKKQNIRVGKVKGKEVAAASAPWYL